MYIAKSPDPKYLNTSPKCLSKLLPAGARERLVLRLIHASVCLSVCLFVRPHLSRVQNITSYVTMQLQCIAAFGGLRAKLQQMKVVLCCLDGENVVGSRKDPVLVAYSS